MLFAVLVVLALLIVRAVRRRWKVAPTTVEALLPDLVTDVRVHATIRRVFRDPDQGVFLVEASVEKRKWTFCAVDYESHAERYTGAIGQSADFALYALGTLEAGGAEAIPGQIVDLDRVAEPLTEVMRLVPAGGFPNDYAVIGRVVSQRDEILRDAPVRVYRTQVEAQSLSPSFIDVAVEASEQPPFAADLLVHGSARLFAYFAI